MMKKLMSLFFVLGLTLSMGAFAVDGDLCDAERDDSTSKVDVEKKKDADTESTVIKDDN